MGPVVTFLVFDVASSVDIHKVGNVVRTEPADKRGTQGSPVTVHRGVPGRAQDPTCRDIAEHGVVGEFQYERALFLDDRAGG